MLAQTKHRFSVKEYYRMAETGVLKPDARVELINGEIIDVSPIGPFHGGVVKRLNDYFTRVANDRWLVVVQDPVRLGDYSEPEPDLMLVRRSPDFYTSKHPEAQDVLLLIEVSDTSLEIDRKEKLPAYGQAGIPEVWIVNLNERTIEVYREPNFSGYGAAIILRTGDKASPQAFPDVMVDVATLLMLTK